MTSVILLQILNPLQFVRIQGEDADFLYMPRGCISIPTCVRMPPSYFIFFLGSTLPKPVWILWTSFMGGPSLVGDLESDVVRDVAIAQRGTLPQQARHVDPLGLVLSEIGHEGE